MPQFQCLIQEILFSFVLEHLSQFAPLLSSPLPNPQLLQLLLLYVLDYSTVLKAILCLILNILLLFQVLYSLLLLTLAIRHKTTRSDVGDDSKK